MRMKSAMKEMNDIKKAIEFYCVDFLFPNMTAF